MMWRMALIIFGNISGATKTENRTRPRTRALPNENDGAPEQLRTIRARQFLVFSFSNGQSGSGI